MLEISGEARNKRKRPDIHATTSSSSLCSADCCAESNPASLSSEERSLRIAREAISEVMDVRSGGGGGMSGTGELVS